MRMVRGTEDSKLQSWLGLSDDKLSSRNPPRVISLEQRPSYHPGNYKDFVSPVSETGVKEKVLEQKVLSPLRKWQQFQEFCARTRVKAQYVIYVISHNIYKLSSQQYLGLWLIAEYYSLLGWHIKLAFTHSLMDSLVAQMVKNPPAMWKTRVSSLGWEDTLEDTHSCILAWRIPMDREAWKTTDHRLVMSRTWLSD